MATVNNFEDLSIWQKSRDICQRVFKFTEAQPSAKDFTFKDQIRRSSGSIMDNIAEGFGRQGSKEFIQFLSIAQGSCAEVQSQLYRALDQKYIIEKDFNEIFDFAENYMQYFESRMLSTNRMLMTEKEFSALDKQVKNYINQCNRKGLSLGSEIILRVLP